MREPNGSRPLSIGIACSSRELFGADRSAVRLAKVLRSLGHEPTLLLPEQRPERGLTSHAEASGLETRTVPIAVASNAGIDGLGGRLMPQRRDRFDVLIYNTSAVLSVAARADRTVTIIREWLNPTDRRHRAIASVHGRRSDAVVAISTGVAVQWEATKSRGPAATVIPNWLSCDALDAGRSPGGDGILCVGRFNRWKGQEVLANAYADAFGDVEEQRPQLCFVGAEPGSEHAQFSEDIERKGQSTGLWQVKPFTPDPTPDLAASALLVVPSLQPEPFGMVILEALNQGCEVLAFEGGGPDDLARSFPKAVQTVSREPGSLTDALNVWHEGGARPAIEHSGQVRAVLESSYSETPAAKRWERLLAATAA